MRQLVGLPCARCEKTIPSIIDGTFCPECGCPVHHRCAQPDENRPDGCSVCGATVQAAQANQQQEKSEAMKIEQDLRMNRAFRHISIGSACLIGGVLGFVMCGYFGLGLAVFGFLQLGFGLVVMARKGPPEY